MKRNLEEEIRKFWEMKMSRINALLHKAGLDPKPTTDAVLDLIEKAHREAEEVRGHLHRMIQDFMRRCLSFCTQRVMAVTKAV